LKNSPDYSDEGVYESIAMRDKAKGITKHDIA
jgi:hypothetical protein